jgi:hypothetical protein
MKKALLISILAILSVVAHAQFTFGPKVGFNAQKLSVDQSTITTDFKNNFNFGAYVRVGDKIYIQPEVNYFTTGTVFKRIETNSLSPFEQDITLKNIQIPLFIGFKIIDLELFNLRATAGPTANIVVGKTIESLDSENFIEPIKKTDISDINWGFQFGAGVDVLMFSVDIQYIMGLNNLIKTVNIGGTPVQFDSKNQGFVVTLGWKIL